MNQRNVVDTDRPPEVAARKTGRQGPNLLVSTSHTLCGGCGEPLAIRALLEVLDELGLGRSVIGVVGIGCYTLFTQTVDVEVVQAMHGRAPSLATGVRRMRPEATVFTLQGDGDMASEGLQEVLHTAARGEAVTAILLNNGVFGETGGHMTATTVVGQRYKNGPDGRDAARHGHPIEVARLLTQIDGVAYVARGSVHSAGHVAATKRMLGRAFRAQVERRGFSFVEILTMCPTGWGMSAAEAPAYMERTLGQVHRPGELVNCFAAGER